MLCYFFFLTSGWMEMADGECGCSSVISDVDALNAQRYECACGYNSTAYNTTGHLTGYYRLFRCTGGMASVWHRTLTDSNLPTPYMIFCPDRHTGWTGWCQINGPKMKRIRWTTRNETDPVKKREWEMSAIVGIKNQTYTWLVAAQCYWCCYLLYWRPCTNSVRNGCVTRAGWPNSVRR